MKRKITPIPPNNSFTEFLLYTAPNGKVKVEIGIAKGKEARDKRESLKDRAVKREMDREKANFNRKHG